MNRIAPTIAILVAAGLAGCDPRTSDHPNAASAAAPAKAATQPAAPTHDHATPAKTIDLGTTKIGEFSVLVTRDEAEIKPGGDAPIDVWVTTADGKPATVIAVRFWIGHRDARGSVKARAAIEDPAQPNHWHTHTDVPSPLPDGARLWVEIESSTGKAVGEFELKQ